MDDGRASNASTLLQGLSAAVILLILGSTAYALWIALVNVERIGV